jgi:hypothetical protein
VVRRSGNRRKQHEQGRQESGVAWLHLCPFPEGRFRFDEAGAGL